MRIVALLATVLFCNAAGGGTDSEFKQTPLHGKLAKIKLALNQPLSVWQKLDGMAQPAGANPHHYKFIIGEYTLSVMFDHKTGLATEVSVYRTNEDEQLPLSDAQLIAASVGLTHPRKDEEGEYEWGKPDDPISAIYNPNDGSLVIELAGFVPSHV
jgi:hypothetical protein